MELTPTAAGSAVIHAEQRCVTPAGALPQVPGYQLEQEIGAGGMATVYQASQCSLQRAVAVKLLAPGLREQARFVKRFEREANLQATLQHPHIVPVYEAGVADGVPFIAMALIDGPTLRSLIRVAALPAEQAVVLLAGIADALDFAHAHGILHGDVKPHNILVEHGNHAWLADFGLTRMLDEATGVTGAGSPAGSADYLAPELAAGMAPSPACDIYSLAVTAFQTLTGELPFPAVNQSQSLLAHAHARRPRASRRAPQLPRAVDAVLRAGMAIDPAARPASAGLLIERLRVALGLPAGSSAGAQQRRATGATELGQGGGRHPGPELATLAGSGRRPRWRMWGGGAAAGLLALAAVLTIAAGGDRQRSRPAATPSASHLETVGGPSHSWSDYRAAGGRPGAVIAAYHSVRIACRVRGFTVSDGDVWWYRIASAPWDGHYYVSADAFYNNGETHGTLLRTPFFDRNVPLC